MAVDEAVLDRIRDVLLPLAMAAGADCEEKRMFGGVCFMVGGRICCCAHQAGLLVRVDREGMEQTLSQPHVGPMEMRGRRMSGFVIVAPEGFATFAALKGWAERGMAAAAVAATSA